MRMREQSPFGSLLLRHRVAARMTQEQLAARAGLSPDAIAALERGKRRTPRRSTVALLATALLLSDEAQAEFVAAGQAPVATPWANQAGHASSIGSLMSRWPLPSEPTALVGRTSELDTILQRLTVENVRLLTLVGPAGVGKTRLALAAAARLTENTSRFPDGVVVVDLTPVRDPNLVPSAIAGRLGLLDVGSSPIVDRLVDTLVDQRLLVVLDNFEQVLPAATSLADLLVACPRLALLVTSRAPLRLRWEQTLRIAPLPIPDLSAPLPPPDTLLRVPAVALFVGSARAHRADFAFGERQAPLVAQLVAQLDGLPLALELAAARLDVLALPTLARRLDDRLQLLASQAPDRPKRQQSLEAAVGWSYDLLSEPERQLFRCLGVFVGCVSLDAITEVVGAVSAAGGGGAGDAEPRDAGRMLSRLLSLAEKSLVLPLPAQLTGLADPSGQRRDGKPAAFDGTEEDDDWGPVFGMLETVRTYAEERLDAADELAAARRAHAQYFLALAERADGELRGRDQRKWYLRLERKHDNLRAALRWLLDQDDPADRESALRLAGALGWFWSAVGYHAEGIRWVDEALARAPSSPGDPAGSAAHTRALIGAGELLAYQGHGVRAGPVLGEALALARQRHDIAGIVQALNYLGAGALFIGDVEEAVSRLHEALDQARELIDPHPCGIALFVLGLATSAQGDDVAAAAYYVEALKKLEAAGDMRIASHVRFNLAAIMGQQGDLPSAVALVRAGIVASATLCNRFLLLTGVRAALTLLGERGDPADPVRGVRLLGATDALTQATGTTLGAAERVAADGIVMGLRERLAQGEEDGGAGGLAAAYREGRLLPFSEVATLTLELLEELARPLRDLNLTPESAGACATSATPQHTDQRQSPLTVREAEVLRLVAQGYSSKAIGKQLFLSPSTINQHVTSIFNKLAVDTRAQAVAVAAQRGLL